MKHIMLDLETLSTYPNAAILSIGACVFYPYSLALIKDTFERGVAEVSARELGHVEQDTVDWWRKQSKEARDKAFSGTLPLHTALTDFRDWATEGGKINGDDIVVWGNGANFDQVIIRSAYRSCNKLVFWPFWNDRCHRTVVNLLPRRKRPIVKSMFGELKHDALSDALNQARLLQLCFSELGVTE